MTQWIYLQRKTHCYLTPFIEVIGKVYSSTAREVWFGKSFEDYFVTYTKGVMTWYGKKEVIDELYPFVSKRVIKHPAYLNDSYNRFKPEIKKLMAFSSKINKIKMSGLENPHLWGLYLHYIQLYEKATVYGEPLPLVTKDFVLQEIKEKLKGKENVNELITLLSTPTKKSFVRKEEEELLAIGQSIQKEKKLLKQFSHSNEEIIAKIKGTDIFGRIKRHQKKYCWIPYDYGVQLWDLSQFITSLKSILSRDCAAELREKKEECRLLSLRQQKALRAHTIQPRIAALFEYVRLATYMMDYKKEMFTKSHYLIIPLIEEIAKRSNTNSILVRFMNHKEIKNALLEYSPVPEKTLQERFTLGVCLWDREGNTKFLDRSQVQDFIRKHIQDNPEEQKGTKIYGTCASVGKHQGKVKIVMSAMHITKVEKGDILIAPMTSPDYIAGMRNAGAIVTDEGGITCHAAIVSRELKIPCIVGTMKATKTFRDGDLVEVNASHGSVRKL